MQHGRRPGIALVITLLGIMVLEVVIAGTFHVAMQQRRIATAHTRSAQLEAAARAAVARALNRWPVLGADTLPPGRDIAVTVEPPAGGAVTNVTLRRLPPALFLLTVTAHFPRSGEQRRVAVILRERTIAEYFRAIPAAGWAATALVNGTVDGNRPAACTVSDAPAAVAPLALQDTIGAPAGSVLLPGALQTPAGWFAGTDLRTGTSNPAQVIDGDYRISSDVGPILLVVQGDVAIAAGVRFDGLLLAGGRVTVEDGAAVNGAVRAARIELLGGTLRFDPCVLLHLFAAVPALRGPVRADGHWWIPAA